VCRPLLRLCRPFMISTKFREHFHIRENHPTISFFQKPHCCRFAKTSYCYRFRGNNIKIFAKIQKNLHQISRNFWRNWIFSQYRQKTTCPGIILKVKLDFREHFRENTKSKNKTSRFNPRSRYGGGRGQKPTEKILSKMEVRGKEGRQFWDQKQLGDRG
jgi:hypothetical protein